MGHDAGADSAATPAVCPSPRIRTAGRELPVSCGGITDRQAQLSKPWQPGSCRASSSGGCTGAGADSRHRQPSSVAGRGSQPSQNLPSVSKLTSQRRVGLGFSVSFASLPSYYDPFLSFPLLQIIYEW